MGLVADDGTSLLLLSTINEVTGSLFITLLFIIMSIIFLAFLLRIPVEFTAILILPFLLTVSAYESSLMAVTGVLLIYLGLILAKNMFFYR